jgi:DNA-binding transcriptional LysR family regulator
MNRDVFGDLVAFVAVAQAGSFTKAAGRLGLSQSALSHLIRALETRLGFRLLARTTRSVAPTSEGARLLARLEPMLSELDAELADLSQRRSVPRGKLRLTASDHVVQGLVLPRLASFLVAFPDVQVEVIVDYALTDIVADGFDAGIRLGEQVDKDMIAVRIGPDFRMAVVATPAYFAANPPPMTPSDLTAHRCINLRLQSAETLYAWEFAKDGRALKVKVDGQLTFNHVPLIVQAAQLGMGVAFTTEDRVADDLQSGRLLRVLQDWCPVWPGYHLYYPSRRQQTAAFARLVDALRWT